MQTQNNRTSLRTKFNQLIALAALPALILVSISAWLAYDTARDAARTQLVEVTKASALQYDQLLSMSERLLRLIGETEEFRKGGEESCSAYLSRAFPPGVPYGVIFRINREGDVTCSSMHAKHYPNFKHHPAFPSLWGAKGLYIQHNVAGPVSKDLVTTITARLEDQSPNETPYLISVGIDPKWLSDMVGLAELPPGYSFTLLDGEGRIVIRYPNPELWVGEYVRGPAPEGIKRGEAFIHNVTGVDGVKRVLGSTIVGEGPSSLYLSVGAPLKQIYDLPNLILGVYIGTVAMGVIGMLIATTIGTNTLIQNQFGKILDFAAHMGTGNFYQRLVLNHPTRETTALSDAMNRMAESLARNNEDLRKLSLVAQNTNSMVIITDPAGQIEWVNPAFESAAGFSLEEVSGRAVDAWLYGEGARGIFAAKLRALWVSAQAGEAETQYNDKHGRRIWCTVALHPIKNRDNRLTHFIIVQNDITERKLTELYLEEARIAAERARRMQSEFLATMSHEIRTPMNGVLGMADLLKDAKLSEEERRYLDAIIISGNGLLTLINDILDLSKLEARRVELASEPTAVKELIENVIMLMSVSARNKGLALKAEIAHSAPIAIICDAQRLRQVLVNLVGNAVKFTDAGSITIAAEGYAVGGKNYLQIRVTDTGIGVPAHAQPQMFNKFTQADAGATRQFGGTGLGLAISRELIELMGGRIWLCSLEGEGATFAINLPVEVCDIGLWQRHRQEHLAKAPQKAETPPLRILVAEDNAVNQALVCAMLGRLGHDVVVANDGVEAVAAIEASAASPYDLVLMDINMPNMDGVTATQKIRNLPRPLSAIPIIALTANAMDGDRELYLSKGMTGYIAKPIDRVALMRALALVAKGEADPGAADADGITPEMAEEAEVVMTETSAADEEALAALLASLE